MEYTKTFSDKKFQYSALFLILLLIISPFLVISIYNHPSADDFCYTVYANSMEFWAVQLDHYLTWTGRYSATLLLTLSKTSITNLLDHQVIPVLLLLLFCFSIYFFVHQLLPGLRSLHKSWLSIMILFLYLAGAPKISEAFYWKPAALTYQLALNLGLIFFGLLLYLRRQKSRNLRLFLTFLASALSVFIIGLNETTMIMLCAIVFVLVVLSSFRKKRLDIPLFVVMIFTVVAAVIVIKAPGNLVRMSEKPLRGNLPFSVSYALRLTRFYVLLKWLPLFVPVIVIFWGSLRKAAFALSDRFGFFASSWWHLLLYLFCFLGLIALTFFPSPWSQGGAPPTRTINTIYLLFILGALGFTILGMIFVRNRKKRILPLPFRVKLLAGVLTPVLLATKTENIKFAYRDLLSGSAARYDLEMRERYSLIEDCKGGNCLVPPLKHRPPTIFAYDLASDPTSEVYYYNKCLEIFFGKRCLFATRKAAEKQDAAAAL